MCRRNDADRASKFLKALQVYKAEGIMGDLDDGPEQKPLESNHIESILMELLPLKHYDMIVTHNPMGEYTRHLRHEEIGKMIMNLWIENKLSCSLLKTFAYQDDNRMYFPKAIPTADQQFILPKAIWRRKYQIITNIYGFIKESWEAKTTPKIEAFYNFNNKGQARSWLNQLTRL